MDRQEIEGKKVLFIYPHIITEKKILRDIVKNEYEAYKINCHLTAMEIVKHYKNPILFLNVDHGLTVLEWEEYAKSIINSLETGDVKIKAIVDEGSRQKELLSGCHYLNQYINLGQDVSKSVTNILAVLKKNNAMGQRKYIRIKCRNIHQASFSVKKNKNIHLGMVNDISSFGIACSFEKRPILTMNERINDLQLRLNGVPARGSGKVIGIRDDGKIYVIQFDRNNSQKFKDLITNFIFQSLQKNFEQLVKKYSRPQFGAGYNNKTISYAAQ